MSRSHSAIDRDEHPFQLPFVMDVDMRTWPLRHQRMAPSNHFNYPTSAPTPDWMLGPSAVGGGVSQVRPLPFSPTMGQLKATNSKMRRPVADHVGSQGEISMIIAASGASMPNIGGNRNQ